VIVCPSCRAEYEEASTRYCGRCGSDMRRPPGPAAVVGMADPMIGRVIDGRYRILEKLGQGGMGAVYKVEHLAMGKHAAMKLLHPGLTQDAEVHRRFRREAEAVSRLSHPNTVQVFDFGESRGFMYLVMELVRGEDLGVILRRDGPLPFRRTRRILTQVCDALSEAHDAGVVHRDLKPENLLVARTRDGHDLVKVLDFGLAKLRDVEEANQVTARGSLIGTPFYMSPEQIRGEDLDARSDLYSLGAVAYRILTGEHPYSAPTPVAVLTQHLTEELVLPSQRRPDLKIDPFVDDLVGRAMAKRREDRFASADEFRQALERAGDVSAGHTLPRSADKSTDKSTEKSPDKSPDKSTDKSPEKSKDKPTEKRRASDGALDPTGSQAIEPQLRREDFDAYERALKRRRWMGLGLLPAALIVIAGAVALIIEARRPRARDLESEPNNNAAEANLIASEHTVRGHIGTRISVEESDRDFYHFQVLGGVHSLRAELTGIAGMDLKLEVFDPLGRRIAEADAGGPGEGEIIPNARLDPGEYYVAVREVWVGGRPATENDTDWYTLTASWRPVQPNQETEPDDSPSAAVPLALDQPMLGYLGRPGDVDYFYPRGEGGGTLSGYLTGIEGVDTRLVVLPPGSASGPPGPLPPGARVFDEGGLGASERFEGVAWPEGSTGPIIVVERKEKEKGKEKERDHQRGGHVGSAPPSPPRLPEVGLDVPYTLTVRMTR
jgi:serine/threonine-protein kinase